MVSRRVRIALVLLTVAGFSHALIDDALDVIKLGKEIGEEVLSSWDVLGKPFNVSGGVELPLVRRRERVVLARLAQVSRAIEQLEVGLEKVNTIALLLAKTVGRGTGLELRLHETAILLSNVASLDRQMREYVRLQQDLERSTLIDFAEQCVSHDVGALPGMLERIHTLIVPVHHNLLGHGLLEMIVNNLQEDHPELCDLQMSPHQVIYDMYNTISLTEIKGYAMMQFSWMLLRVYGKGNYTQEANLTRQRYGERASRAAAAAKSALAIATRDLYRCDPPNHEEGVTYAEVTRLLQGYIENEVDMNPKRTCKENCGFYSLTESYGCYHDDMYCRKQPRCQGRILDCQYIDSDMWICPASRDSNRRYEYIEYENHRVLGHDGHAGTCKRGTTKVDSWWRWLFWHCSYCMCLCEETGPKSHKYFSLREAIADAANNKVVTGVRLIKQGRVFHLQVSEGTLGERGKVTPAGWVPVQKFDPHDMGVTANVDYHELTYEKRAIDLDELDSPSGHILTGVRFRMHGPHLHFEIRSTPFNYTSGRLTADKSQWISNDNTDGADTPRSRLRLYTPDIPTRFNIPQPVDSKHDQFIEFTNTDLDADAAQSTVPFVDIQPVYPLKGTALISGAGIIHRGVRRSGGFIAVKVFTYDYSKHVKATAPLSDFEDAETTEYTPIVN